MILNCGSGYCFAIVASKEYPGQQKGSSQAGVEKRNESFRREAASAQQNPGGHHHSHDAKAFPVKELQEKMPLLGIGVDSGGVLFYQLTKDKLLKYRENQS